MPWASWFFFKLVSEATMLSVPANSAVYDYHCAHIVQVLELLDKQRFNPSLCASSKCNTDCSLSRVRLFATPWTAAHQVSLYFTISQSLLSFMSIESVTPSNHLLLFPSTFNLSQHQGLFQWVSCSHQVGKVLEHQHQSFQWDSGLISFKIDWFDLLAFLGLSRVFSNTTVWKHQLFGVLPSLWSCSHICTWLLEITLIRQIFVNKLFPF